MEIKELIEVLRHCGRAGSECHNCKMYDYSAGCLKKLCSEAAEALESQQKRISEQEEQRRWIPVTERLPEKTRKYLVVKKEIYGNVIGTAWYFLPCPPDGIGGWNSKNEITHWMPLPELLKEDT